MALPGLTPDSDDDKEQQLYQYLMQQKAMRDRQNSPEYRQSQNQDLTDTSNLRSQNALAASLMQSAGQIGSIHGKVASAAPVDEFAKNQAAARTQYMGGLEQQDQDQQKNAGMDSKLYEYLADRQNKAKQNSAMNDIKEQGLDLKQKSLDQQGQYQKDRLDMMGKINDAKNEASQAKAAVGQGKDQDKVYTELVNKINTPRGSQAVQQAQKSLVNVQNAKDLINLYPNANDMPEAQVQRLNEELGKIATGGVATEGSTRAGDAGTFAQKFAKFQSQVEGKPEGADLGAFIAENKKYLDSLERSHKKIISDYQKKIYGGYKHRLNPDQDKDFQTEYPDLFQQETAATPTPTGEPGTAQAAPGQQKQTLAPDEIDKLKKELALNPVAPRAARIRQVLQDQGAIEVPNAP